MLGATFCYSLSTMLVRLVSRHDQDAATLFWFAIVSSARFPGGAIPHWIWPTPIDWLWLIVLGLLGGVGAGPGDPGLAAGAGRHSCPLRLCGYRAGHRYGYFWFQEQASWTVWLGLPLVIASGLYILHRERVRAHATARH